MKAINQINPCRSFLMGTRRAAILPTLLMCIGSLLYLPAKSADAGTVLADSIAPGAALFAGNQQGQLYRIDRDNNGDFVSQAQIATLPGPIWDIAFYGSHQLFASHGSNSNQQISRVLLNDNGNVLSVSTWLEVSGIVQLRGLAVSPSFDYLFYTKNAPNGFDGNSDTVERVAILPNGNAGTPVVVASNIPVRHRTNLSGIAFNTDPDADNMNHLFVTDFGNDYILVVNDPFAENADPATNRTIVQQFGLSNFASIAFDRNNTMFVTDWESANRDDDEIRTDGLAVYLGSGAIRSDPWDIAVDGDANGSIYFSFLNNGFIQRQLRNPDGSRNGAVQDFASGLGTRLALAFRPASQAIPEPRSLALLMLAGFLSLVGRWPR